MARTWPNARANVNYSNWDKDARIGAGSSGCDSSRPRANGPTGSVADYHRRRELYLHALARPTHEHLPRRCRHRALDFNLSSGVGAQLAPRDSLHRPFPLSHQGRAHFNLYHRHSFPRTIESSQSFPTTQSLSLNCFRVRVGEREKSPGEGKRAGWRSARVHSLPSSLGGPKSG
jgi:hypothetical protein